MQNCGIIFAMRRRRRFLKLFLFLLLIILVSLPLAVWYLNEKVLPEKLKPRLIAELKKTTSKEVTLSRIYLNHRGLILKDMVFYETQDTPLIEIPDIAIWVNPIPLIIKRDIYFNINLKLGRDSFAKINACGTYNLRDKTLDAIIITGDVECVRALNYLNKKLPFEVNAGRFSLNLKLLLDKDRNLFSRGVLNLNNVNIAKEELNISGSARTDFNISKKRKEPINYAGEASVDKINISGIPYINSIEDISGRIIFSREVLTSSDLNGFILGNGVYLRGTFENFSNPFIKTLINLEVDIVKMLNLCPVNIKKRVEKFDLKKGTASMNLLLNGTLRNMYYALDIRLKDVEFNYKGIDKPFSKIDGLVSIKKDFLSGGLSGIFMDKNYVVNVEILNFRKPDISLVLNSDELHIETKCEFADNELSFSKFDGKIYNTSFNLIGESNVTIPSFNAYGDILLDLDDLKKIFPKIADFCDKNKICGNARLNLFLNGEGLVWRDWEIGIKVKSDEIGFLTYKVNDLYADLRLKDRILKIASLNLKPYDGLLFLRGSFDLNQAEIPYSLDIDLSGLELNKLVQDTQLKKKDIAGSVSLKILANGNANNFDSLKAKGWLKIINGNLWEISFLKGLADILFMPNLRTIIFKEAFANFEITDRKISTSDALLTSDQLNLIISGLMDFDGNLDLVITTSFSRNFVNKTASEKIKTLVLDSLGRLVGEVHVTGSLKEPKYTVKPARFDKMLLEKFKNFFGNILK
ncbi:MAG: DUF748 domain-containing protein [Candidatus Omnitrophica bacterium]|nr:DUF748 domain-containing protein [Candidatus Omnitrophota bacterium]